MSAAPNQFGYTCPECGCGDSLDVVALVCVRLTPEGSSADDARDGSHDWDDLSSVSCGCGWSGAVGDLVRKVKS